MTIKKIISGSDKPRMIPIMSEPVGAYSIEREMHLKFKSLINNIFQNANDNLRRQSEMIGIENICNRSDQNVFKKFHELSELESILKNMGVQFLRTAGYICEDLVCTDAWLNKGNANSFLPIHSHDNSYISGTYYVNFDPKKHQPLTFINDRSYSYAMRNLPTIAIPSDTNNPTQFNLPKIQLPCSESTVLFWRSHLKHGFTGKNEHPDRTTLSFNLIPRVCSTSGGIYSFTLNDE